MGAYFSDINTVDKNQYLSKLVDVEHIGENDPYWNQLLSFNFKLPFNQSNSKIVDENIALLCQKFVQNNPTSSNYASLIKVFCMRANQIKEMNDNNAVVSQTKNCLFIIRCFTKYLIEIDAEVVFLSHLKILNIDQDRMWFYYLVQDKMLCSFIKSLYVCQSSHAISDFVKTLLNNMIEQIPNPPDTNASNNRSVISSVASGLWSVVTLGYSSTSPSSSPKKLATLTDASSIESIDCQGRLLALQSCHALLILSNYCTSEHVRNPYRLALFHFTNIQDVPTSIPSLEPLAWFSLDYTKLYNIFCLTMSSDQYTLFLYMLLHRNQHFKMFILSRANIDCLIVPILRVVYAATERNSHHIYMALIILLILSEDDLFNKSIHGIQIKRLLWYTERSITEISLGGLVVLVVIRAIQYNMTRMRDKYLHTNCLATLANMSSKFHTLHPYVCQRINSIFNLLAKKQAKIYALINEEAATNGSTDESKQDYLQDLSILEELMRMVLEIINSCLNNAIHHNGNLVYSILYNKSSFLQFKNHPSFQDVFQNIDLVIAHFSKEIENLEDKSVEKLKEIIEFGIKQFSRERFRKFPELKFKYVEEDQPEEFFVPYVWTLVNQTSGLFWIDRTNNFFPSITP